MSRPIAALTFASVLAVATPAVSNPSATLSGISIVQAKDHKELNKKWCTASPDTDHIFIVPAALFVDSRELICDSGAYKLYRVVAADDPDDFEYYIDPPFGKENRLGCDGKAGLKMKVIAVNCRPE